MSKVYYQCHLREVGGDIQTNAWIESHGAENGKTMTLDGYEGRRFRVVSAYRNTPMTEEMLRKKQQLDRGSLPSIVVA